MIVCDELADRLFECGVLGGDPLDGFFGPFGFQVADLAEELADADALVRISAWAASSPSSASKASATTPGGMAPVAGAGSAVSAAVIVA
jgi:hypothetical protein